MFTPVLANLCCQLMYAQFWLIYVNMLIYPYSRPLGSTLLIWIHLHIFGSVAFVLKFCPQILNLFYVHFLFFSLFCFSCILQAFIFFCKDCFDLLFCGEPITFQKGQEYPTTCTSEKDTKKTMIEAGTIQ